MVNFKVLNLIRQTYNRYKNKLSRIIAYLPILWKIEEWDYGYLLHMWAFTLDRHIKKTYDEGIHVTTKSQKRRALACSAALRRLAKDEYGDYYLNKMFKDMPKKFVPLTEDFKKTKQYKKFHENHIKLAKVEIYLYNQDCDLIHKFLKKELKKLWD